MIFAMSDIHGKYELFEKRITQIKQLLKEKDNKLILLGDYIDRGSKSYECLQLAYDLERELGTDKVIVLKGNHEVWFEEFLFNNDDIWLGEDRKFCTSRTFLNKEQINVIDMLYDREKKIEYVKEKIKENHKHLLLWMRKLRLFYETDTQIFVHAGVDEDIPEEEIEWCTLATPEYVLTGKTPPSVGHFYKDVIAGHIAASSVAGDKRFKGIYYDGESHYYIDGTAVKNNRLLCMAYDEDKKKYYELNEDGEFYEITGNHE